MHGENIRIENYSQNGNYSFQYCKNVEIRNAVINSKDAFWNTENVTVYDSELNGEYLGWHSRNLRLVNCRITGTQALCYAHDLVMENCTMGENADLCFEFSSVQATINSPVHSVKNPRSGRVKQDWIVYTTGVVPALSAIIKALTTPKDCILVQTPVYNCFFSSIRNNGCEMVANPLIYTDDTYRIDFVDLARQAADPNVKLLLLCNPHNPAGRVWTRQELTRIGEICLRNDVLVVADEIHCELTYPGYDYTPFASISDEFLMHSVTCTSPSKAFNLAGLQIANIFCADEVKRRQIDKAININEVCDVNPFGVEALIAAR